MKNAITSPQLNDQGKSDSKTQSQNKIILNWLKQGRTLTASFAADKLHIYRLSARIFDLKRQGHPIKSELRFHGSEHWSLYSLYKKQ